MGPKVVELRNVADGAVGYLVSTKFRLLHSLVGISQLCRLESRSWEIAWKSPGTSWQESFFLCFREYLCENLDCLEEGILEALYSCGLN